MRWSLGTSLALHAAILVAALIVLPGPGAFKIDPQPAIQVDISKIGDVSKRMATVKDAEAPKDKPAPPKADTLKTADPAPKEAPKEQKAVTEAKAEPPPPPKDEPKKDEAKPLDPAALKNLIKDTVKEEPKPKDKPKKVEKKQPKLNPDEIAAFLNKVDESKAPKSAAATDAQPAKGVKNIQGTDNEMSATIIEAFAQKMKECWTVPPGALEANIVVQVHFRLNPDGTVNGLPEVMNASADPLFDATARSAVSAIIDCQAYDFLPKDRYQLWQDNTFTFNPNMMFGSTG